MGSDHIFRPGRFDGDTRHLRIEGAPGSVKQDKGARVFAAIAIFLFACYLVGAVTAVAP
jgi:hypothetical protein